MNSSCESHGEESRHALLAELPRLRELLAGHAEPSRCRAAPPRREPPSPPALERLCRAFGLTSFEGDLLLLCAGIELDAELALLCGDATGDRAGTHPTFALALAVLPEAHWSAISPGGALRYWRLIDVLPGDSLTSSPLRLDERVLHHLLGADHLDQRLQGIVRPVAAGQALAPAQIALAQQIAEGWAHTSGPWPVIELGGERDHGAHDVAAAVCARLEMRLHAVRGGDLRLPPAERDALARLWERESVLGDSAILLDCEDLEGRDQRRAVEAFAEQIQGALFLCTREPLRLGGRPILRLEVPRPNAREQSEIWRRALGPIGTGLNGQLDALVAQFDLGVAAIEATSGLLRDAGPEKQGAAAEFLWQSCRRQARGKLDDLAQRIEPAATWSDLVLPEPQQRLLRDLAASVRSRATVYQQWGFGARGARGLGITALFAGPSGTGKTMAAEVLANELRLDLYRVDLSAVVSKYIGETEKNLRRIFAAAEASGAILLFDEADALFGKRSEVKDSHDRYANIEVSYLLQRMEAYSGLAILTTNLRQALDPAFSRRLRFIVQFPFPDPEQRAEIWRRVFPAATPTLDLDLPRLARLSIAGGTIHNIALNAAFLAADDGGTVRMAHVLRAARTEYAKLERPLTEAELGGRG